MEQTIEFKIPDGYVFDKDNSTENVIRFKPIKKTITYEDIVKKLYPGKCYYINNNHTSEKQICQLLYLNKLMNVAKYLNGDWKPDFTDTNKQKWFIDYDSEESILGTDFIFGVYRNSNVYFESEELAKQAIEILGEEEVKKALGIFE